MKLVGLAFFCIWLWCDVYGLFADDFIGNITESGLRGKCWLNQT